MRRQDGAEEVWAVGAHQLAGVVGQDVHHVPGVRSRPEGPRGGHGPVAVSNLTAGEGRGGRREPSGGGRLYGNMHHNSLGQCHLTGLFGRKTVSFLVSFPPHADGLRSPKGWRRERTSRPQNYSTDTVNSDDWSLYHQHRMNQPEEHQGLFVSH